MISSQTSAGDQRDRGLERLRNLTVATAVGATGLAALLSMVAALSIPGQGGSGSPTSGTGQGAALDPNQSQNLGDDQQNQNAFGGFLSGGGGGSPVAVSGGSHP